MLFMVVSTVVAMVSNLRLFWQQWDEGGSVLFLVGLVLMVLALWLVFEAMMAFLRLRDSEIVPTMAVTYSTETQPRSLSE